MQQPDLGLTTKVELISVVDGDTIRVKMVREIDVRITDDQGTFNTPETRKPHSEEEREKGLEAKAYLTKLLTDADDIVLFVPASDDGQLKDLMTLGRVVGHVFANKKDVTDLMTLAGHNVKLKRK
jgi:endonuclease YncB( thermonuclease family)